MDLTDAQIDQLATEIQDYQITHGSLLKLVRFQEATSVPSRPVSTSLYPTPFSKKLFDHALHLQQSFNALYIRLSNDHNFLEGLLRPLFRHNDFIHTLWMVHVEAKAISTQAIVCGLFRSDYMVHRPSMNLKQVEMNTFSISGACHSERVANMHRHMQQVLPAKVWLLAASAAVPVSLPENNNTFSIVETLALAHQHYNPSSKSKLCSLMIVQGMNFNICDERPIEYGLLERGIPMYRLDWNDVLKRTSLDQSEGHSLLYTHPWSGEQYEVSVVYYRAGYESREYEGYGKDIRLRLEQSRAIKCPDILTHLTTLKAVQSALTAPNVLEKYLIETDALDVGKTFMPMQILDDSPEGRAARKWASNPVTAADYVLKPNLEGGGHNIYGSDIGRFLDSIPETRFAEYTIMRMIEPPPNDGILLMPTELFRGPVVNELGVIGACLWRRHNDEVNIISNKVAGWTFKTKPAGVKEMNVVKGNGCFDCPRH